MAPRKPRPRTLVDIKGGERKSVFNRRAEKKDVLPRRADSPRLSTRFRGDTRYSRTLYG